MAATHIHSVYVFVSYMSKLCHLLEVINPMAWTRNVDVFLRKRLIDARVSIRRWSRIQVADLDVLKKQERESRHPWFELLRLVSPFPVCRRVPLKWPG